MSQLDGTIIAPEDPEKWGDDPLDWMVFEWATGLKIQGQGMIDGQGSSWWHVSKTEHMDLSHDDDYEEYSPIVPVTIPAMICMFPGVALFQNLNYHFSFFFFTGKW